MQYSKRQASAIGILLTLIVALTATAAWARPGSPRSGSRPGGGSRQPTTPSQTVTIQGTITALTAASGNNPATLQVTDRNGLSIILKTSATTQITRDNATAAFAALRVGDGIQVTYDRTTLVASRIIATSPPPVQLTGTLTALNVNPVQPAPPAPAVPPSLEVTTDHGTAISLTANNSSTRVTLNGRLTTLASLAIGDRATVTYRTADKLALSIAAQTPALNVVSGAITALTITGATGSLSLTPLAGPVKVIPLTAATRYTLNGRAVTPSTIVVNYLASVQLNSDGSARVVAALTPSLVDLQGTISAITASTVDVTTAALTKITLRLTSQTLAASTRNGAALSATNALKVGDSLVVRYEYRLIPNQSIALVIAATGP